MESTSFIFIIPAAALIGAAIIAKAIIDNWFRSRRREDGDTGRAAAELADTDNNRWNITGLLANLKWSLVLMGLGIPPALSIFNDSIPGNAILGFMLLFSGFGLFIYFLLAKSVLEKYRKNKEADNMK